MPLSEISFKYREEPSSLFSIIKRPLIELEIFSKKRMEWLSFKKMLADTGADISLLPRFMGKLLVDDIETGIYKKIRGVVPYTYLNGFIHTFKLKINYKEFEAPLFIADAEDVTPLIGRVNGLDLFNVEFKKGAFVILRN